MIIPRPLAVPRIQMKELIEWTLFVAAERLSVDEAALPIELERGLESWAARSDDSWLSSRR